MVVVIMPLMQFKRVVASDASMAIYVISFVGDPRSKKSEG